MIRFVIFLACLPFALSIALAAPAPPLQKLEGCKFIPTDWADGDSFQIETPAGQKHTVRLYGVDCLELHLKNDRNLNRFQEQRRYFGITDVGKNREESMKVAESFAKEAADLTAKSLKSPFTLHTRFSNGGGDSNFKRILGFVTLADGRDLGVMLIKEGLARSQGRMSSLPDGTSLVEAKGLLQDTELQSLKKGKGIWAKTDWDKLSIERQQIRKELAEEKIAKKQNALAPDFKINPNVATKKELMALDGIGETLADRIIEERKKAPFLKADDLLRVKRIPKEVFENLKAHFVFQKP